MKLNEIDFSSLDPKEIGSWPLVLRIAIVIIIAIVTIAVTYIFYLTPQIDLIKQQEVEIVSKKNDFRTKYTKAHNIDGYEKQLVELNSSYANKLKQMPTVGNVPELIDAITRIAQNNNLQLMSIRLGDPKLENGFYQSLNLDLEIVGGFHRIGRFLSDISKLSRIVTIHEFNLKKDDKNGTVGTDNLFLKLAIRTYWIASAEEAQDATKNENGNTNQRAVSRPGRPAVVEAQ